MPIRGIKGIFKVPNMKEFEIVEKVGISKESYCAAVRNAITSVKKTRDVYWFEVIEQRGRVTEGEEIEFQVILKIGVV